MIFYQSWDYRNAAVSSKEYCSIDGVWGSYIPFKCFRLVLVKHFCHVRFYVVVCSAIYTGKHHHHHHHWCCVLLLFLLLILYSFLYCYTRADTTNGEKKKNAKRTREWETVCPMDKITCIELKNKQRDRKRKEMQNIQMIKKNEAKSLHVFIGSLGRRCCCCCWLPLLILSISFTADPILHTWSAREKEMYTSSER